MTKKQAQAIRNRSAWMLGKFTKEEIKKCAYVSETSLRMEDARNLLDLLSNIETWREIDSSEEMLKGWIKNAKSIIARIVSLIIPNN